MISTGPGSKLSHSSQCKFSKRRGSSYISHQNLVPRCLLAASIDIDKCPWAVGCHLHHRGWTYGKIPWWVSTLCHHAMPRWLALRVVNAKASVRGPCGLSG